MAVWRSSPFAAEVIIVGAGPAGSAAAICLAERGRDVLLLDRSRFPRDKPCGELVNPAGAAILRQLGILAFLPAGSWRTLRGLLLRGAGDEAAVLDYPHPPGAPHDGQTPTALSVRRHDLDAALVQRAICAGARFQPGCHVEDVLWSHGRVVGVAARISDLEKGDKEIAGDEGDIPSGISSPPGDRPPHWGPPVSSSPHPPFRNPKSEIRNPKSRIVLHAPLVIAADGARSRLGCRVGLLTESRDRRFGLVGHFRGVDADLEQVEMHGLGWGYCGFALTAAGEATAAMVVRESELPYLQGRTAAFFEERLARFTHIAALLRGAERAGPPRVTGPVGVRARRVTCPGLLVAGDAAGFFDPFTGRGITRALRGGRLAAEAAEAILSGSDRRCCECGYTRRLRRIDSVWIVERLIRAFVDRPALLSHAVRRFQQEPALGRLLLGVAGDLLPASAVLNPFYAARLFAPALVSPATVARE